MTPIKILILAANPKGSDRLRLDEEVREIKAALEQSQHRDEFAVIQEWAVRVDDLQKLLHNHAPQVVHFSGHGTGAEGLVLENELGREQPVSTQALAGLFKLFPTVRCVCLNACYSEVQAKEICQYIDCVVGMNQAIGDKAAIQFAKGFYRALGAQRSFQDAYELGKNAIALQNIPDELIPVLKLKPSIPSTDLTLFPLPSSISAKIMNESSSAVPPSAAFPSSSQNRSVSIGGNMTGSVIQTGDSNTASVQFHQVTLPPPDSVNIQTEMTALRELLALLETPDRRKIDNALAEVEDELKKPEPDKAEVGQALERAFNYAQKAEGFSAAIEKLQPRVSKVVSWLGDNWYKILSVVRLGVIGM